MTKIRTTLTATLVGVALTGSVVPTARAAPDPTGGNSVHTELVSHWYLDLLDRSADADDDHRTVTGAARHWVDQLDAGVPHADVLRSITRSQEHAEVVVADLCSRHLLRDAATDPGSRYWVSGIRAGTAPEWVEQDVLASDEHADLAGRQRVRQWYAAILGRPAVNAATPGEVAHWDGVAARDGALAAVRGIWCSPEGVVERTTEMFEALVRRRPTDAEHSCFHGKVVQSAIEAFIEVATSEGYEDHASTGGDFH